MNNKISQKEYNVLAEYLFLEHPQQRIYESPNNDSFQNNHVKYNYISNTQLLAIKTTDHISELFVIDKNILTIWNLFLKFFNCGKLKNLNFKLVTICQYLSKFDWKIFKENENAGKFDPNLETNEKVLKNLSHLAYRAEYYKNSTQLLEKIGIKKNIFTFDEYYTNKYLQVKFLRGRMYKELERTLDHHECISIYQLYVEKDKGKEVLKSNDLVSNYTDIKVNQRIRYVR